MEINFLVTSSCCLLAGKEKESKAFFRPLGTCNGFQLLSHLLRQHSTMLVKRRRMMMSGLMRKFPSISSFFSSMLSITETLSFDNVRVALCIRSGERTMEEGRRRPIRTD